MEIPSLKQAKIDTHHGHYILVLTMAPTDVYLAKIIIHLTNA